MTGSHLALDVVLVDVSEIIIWEFQCNGEKYVKGIQDLAVKTLVPSD